MPCTSVLQQHSPAFFRSDASWCLGGLGRQQRRWPQLPFRFPRPNRAVPGGQTMEVFLRKDFSVAWLLLALAAISLCASERKVVSFGTSTTAGWTVTGGGAANATP